MPREGTNGWSRQEEMYHAPVATGTSAEEYVTDLTLGYTRIYEKVRAIVEVVGTGASASRTFRVIKGASTVVATKTIVLADTTTKGTVIDIPINLADALFTDTDLLTVDVAAGGTSFTTLTLQFELLSRSRPQQVV